MGFFRAFVTANFIPKKVRDAVMLEELKKQNKLLEKIAKQKKAK